MTRKLVRTDQNRVMYEFEFVWIFLGMILFVSQLSQVALLGANEGSFVRIVNWETFVYRSVITGRQSSG